MNLAGRPVAAFDPEGLIFAAGISSESVKLYDLRSFDKGPFSSFKFNGKPKKVEEFGARKFKSFISLQESKRKLIGPV